MKLYCASCGAGNSAEAADCSTCGATLVRPDGARPPVKAEIVDDETPSGMSHAMSIVLAAVCAIYLVNPTFGVFELLPDNIPIVGNLDEASAAAGLLYALSNLGWIPWSRNS